MPVAEAIAWGERDWCRIHTSCWLRQNNRCRMLPAQDGCFATPRRMAEWITAAPLSHGRLVAGQCLSMAAIVEHGMQTRRLKGRLKPFLGYRAPDGPPAAVWQGGGGGLIGAGAGAGRANKDGQSGVRSRRIEKGNRRDADARFGQQPE